MFWGWCWYLVWILFFTFHNWYCTWPKFWCFCLPRYTSWFQLNFQSNSRLLCFKVHRLYLFQLSYISLLENLRLIIIYCVGVNLTGKMSFRFGVMTLSVEHKSSCIHPTPHRETNPSGFAISNYTELFQLRC